MTVTQKLRCGYEGAITGKTHHANLTPSKQTPVVCEAGDMQLRKHNAFYKHTSGSQAFDLRVVEQTVVTQSVVEYSVVQQTVVE